MSHIYASGNLAADMFCNVAAETTDRVLAVRLSNATNDPGMKDMWRFLIARDVMHQQQWLAVIEEMGDRFRGINNTRKVVLMNRSDIDRMGLKVGQAVTLRTVADEGIDRRLPGLLVVAYDIPIGCIGSYYPECNVLLPIWHYATGSKTPAAKMIPVTLHAEDGRVLELQLEYAAG